MFLVALWIEIFLSQEAIRSPKFVVYGVCMLYVLIFKTGILWQLKRQQ